MPVFGQALIKENKRRHRNEKNPHINSNSNSNDSSSFVICGLSRGYKPVKKGIEAKLRMSRQAVIGILGRPTWAVIPSDGGDFALPDPRVKLDLYWKNTPCSPVIVMFNSAYRVTGWDEGIGFCVKNVHLFSPGNEYSCAKADRAKFCK